MPEVSVIVPVYNVEKYLNRCVDSILNQTFTNFELILVNDGSTDESGKICEQYKHLDQRISVIHKKNSGLSDARNKGIDVAVGKYLSFIDSDDWVRENFLQILYDNATRFNAEISAVNFHKEYENKTESVQEIFPGKYCGIDALHHLYTPEMAAYLNIICNKLYDRNLFSDIRFPKGKIHEDSFTTFRLFYVAKSIYYSNDDLYCYFQRDGSIMNQKFYEKRIDEYICYKEQSEFFKKQSLMGLYKKSCKNRLACMKSMVFKMLESDLEDKVIQKWIKIFRDDARKNYGRKQGLPYSFSDCVFSISPKLFYRLHKIKNFARNIERQ